MRFIRGTERTFLVDEKLFTLREKGTVKIAIITMWYNEEILAPFFLSHYSYVDQIRIIIDSDTNDNTVGICDAYPNVVLENFTFPDMMDAQIKQAKLHSVYNEMETDWIFMVDADEFIFPLLLGTDPREVLSKQVGNVMYASMWQVYRHSTDEDLDPTLPAITQRRHGDPDMKSWYNGHYIKPLMARRGFPAKAWTLGCHSFHPDSRIKACDFKFHGTHWKMADPELAVIRRLNAKNRQSSVNLASGFQCHDFNVTEGGIRQACAEHINDPVLF